jgi:hypothetical protein
MKLVRAETAFDAWFAQMDLPRENHEQLIALLRKAFDSGLATAWGIVKASGSCSKAMKNIEKVAPVRLIQ